MLTSRDARKDMALWAGGTDRNESRFEREYKSAGCSPRGQAVLRGWWSTGCTASVTPNISSSPGVRGRRCWAQARPCADRTDHVHYARRPTFIPSDLGGFRSAGRCHGPATESDFQAPRSTFQRDPFRRPGHPPSPTSVHGPDDAPARRPMRRYPSSKQQTTSPPPRTTKANTVQHILFMRGEEKCEPPTRFISETRVRRKVTPTWRPTNRQPDILEGIQAGNKGISRPGGPYLGCVS